MYKVPLRSIVICVGIHNISVTVCPPLAEKKRRNIIRRRRLLWCKFCKFLNFKNSVTIHTPRSHAEKKIAVEVPITHQLSYHRQSAADQWY